MKKHLTKMVLAVVFAVLPTLAWAQNDKVTSYYKVDYALYGSKFQTLEFGLSVDYHLLDRLTVGGELDGALALFKYNGVKSYEKNSTLGVNVGCRAVKGKIFSIDVRGGAGSTLANGDWSYMYYGGSVMLLADFNIGTKPYLGVGYKYYDSRHRAFENQSKIYLTLGVSLGI